MDKGADINACAKKNQDAPRHKVTEWGPKCTVKLSLTKANIKSFNTNKKTSLQKTSDQGHTLYNFY